MEIKPNQINEINKNLREVQDLIKRLIAVQLYTSGATQDEICENLTISKTTVNNMVKGIKKDNKLKTKKDKLKKKKSVTNKQEKVVPIVVDDSAKPLLENNGS